MSFASNLLSCAHATLPAQPAQRKPLRVHSILPARLTPYFSYSSKLLNQQPFSFDTHANALGMAYPALNLLHSLSLSFQRRKCISFPLNTFRTLAQKHPGGTPHTLPMSSTLNLFYPIPLVFLGLPSLIRNHFLCSRFQSDSAGPPARFGRRVQLLPFLSHAVSSFTFLPQNATIVLP